MPTKKKEDSNKLLQAIKKSDIKLVKDILSKNILIYNLIFKIYNYYVILPFQKLIFN